MGLDGIGIKPLILFIIFIVPGLIFRRFYFQGEFSKQFRFKNITTALFSSLVLGVFIQIITIHFYKYYIESLFKSFLPESKDLLSELSSIYNSIAKIQFNAILTEQELSIQIATYLIISFLVSIALAIVTWSFVRLLKLDRRFKIFRFKNHWNYYFMGEIRDFREFNHLKTGKFLYTQADILTQTTSGETTLYSGTLSQYTIDESTNDLKSIYLTEVKRWDEEICSQTGNKKHIDKSFKSDCLIIDNKNVLNINLNFICKHAPKQRLYIPIILLISILFIFLTKWDFAYSTNVFYLIIKKINLLLVATWFMVAVSHFIDIYEGKKSIRSLKAVSNRDKKNKNDNLIKIKKEKIDKAFNFIKSANILILTQLVLHYLLDRFI